MKTTIRNATIVCALAGVMVAGQAMAADIRYRQSGDWTQTAPLDDQPGWRNVSSVPTVDDMGIVNWGGNTLTLTTTETIGALRVGQDEVGNLIVAAGGNLTTDSSGLKDGRLTLGQGNNPAGTGTMTIQSGGVVNVGDILFNGNKANGTANIFGTLNVGSHLWTGWTSGITGTYNINDGGELNVSGMLGLNWQNNGGIGLMNINAGGVVNLSNIDGSGQSIQGSSLLDITGSGTMTLPGDFTGVIINQYLFTGKIAANGVPGAATAYYDGGLDTTFVVVPEPSTFALMGFAGLAMAFRRFRR